MPTYFDLLPEELNIMIWKRVHKMYMAEIKIELEARHIWNDAFGLEDCRRCRNAGARCSDCSIWNWIPQDTTYPKFWDNYPNIFFQAEDDREFHEQSRRLV